MMFENALAELFRTGLVMLLHGTILALVTWLLCSTLMRNARPSLKGVLWTVVLLKFLVPPVLPGEMGLSGWLQAVNPGPAWGLSPSADTWSEADPAAFAAASSPFMSAAAPIGPGGWFYFEIAVLAAYLLGLIVVACLSLARAAALWRNARSLPDATGPLLRQVGDLSRRVGLRKCPGVRTTAETTSPYVIGVFRPILVIPDGLFDQLDGSVHRALILHELAHIKRGDLAVRWIQNTARLLFYFWPPVWWASRRIECFSEMACDQWAVVVSSVHPHTYARSLLDVVRNLGASRQEAQKMAFARRGRLMEERFEMILSKNGPFSPRLSLLMMPALACWISFALAGGSSSEQSEKEKKAQAVAKSETAIRSDDLPRALLKRFPEADLNADGGVSIEELNDYLRATTDGEFSVRIDEAEQPATIFISRIAEGEDAENPDVDFLRFDTEQLLSDHPKADLDGDGQLSREELLRYHHEAGVGVVLEAHEIGEHHGDFEFHEEESEGPESHHRMKMKVKRRILDPAELLAEHPEADMDGDGQLSPDELRTLKRTLAVPHIEFEAEGAPDGDAQTFTWESEEGGRHTVRAVFKGDLKEADLDGDGNISREEAEAFIEAREILAGEAHIEREEGEAKATFVFRKVKKNAADLDGDGTVTQEETLQFGEQRDAERRQQFLKTHPEADLDGDGVINKQEAEALAARLKAERDKSRAKQPPLE